MNLCCLIIHPHCRLGHVRNALLLSVSCTDILYWHLLVYISSFGMCFFSFSLFLFGILTLCCAFGDALGLGHDTTFLIQAYISARASGP